MQHNPCFNPSQTTTIISLNYFDLYPTHNISHLFTKAIVSDNYSFQQDKHHVGQYTCDTVHFINNMPCQLSGLGYGWMITANRKPLSDTKLCIIRVVPYLCSQSGTCQILFSRTVCRFIVRR